MRTARIRSALLASAALATLALASPAHADALLSGAVTAGGKAMGGVTVSARAAGSTITISVFTDAAGRYYFPPLAAGKYQVWAQARSFETGKGEVDLAAARHQDFTLKPMKDYVRQLPGNVILAALPHETGADERMQRLVRNDCTGCHTPSYPLQH